MRVLVVEDNRRLSYELKRGLAYEGYAVDSASSGDEGLVFAESAPYDAIVLDILLPGLDGLTVCQTLRARGYTMPILLLTARDTIADRVRGLDSGADDYLVKPFSPRELVSRVRAILRRIGGGQEYHVNATPPHAATLEPCWIRAIFSTQ